MSDRKRTRRRRRPMTIAEARLAELRRARLRAGRWIDRYRNSTGKAWLR